jgi:hypothetical protein
MSEVNKPVEEKKEEAKIQEVAGPKIAVEVKPVPVEVKPEAVVLEKKEEVVVAETKKEEIFDKPKILTTEELDNNQAKAYVKTISNFGRNEEDFSLLYQRDYGKEKEAQYAKEIAGLGSVLRIISEYDGVKTESSVFVPGASIIELYEDPENPGKLTGRTLAKK